MGKGLPQCSRVAPSSFSHEKEEDKVSMSLPVRLRFRRNAIVAKTFYSNDRKLKIEKKKPINVERVRVEPVIAKEGGESFDGDLE